MKRNLLILLLSLTAVSLVAASAARFRAASCADAAGPSADEVREWHTWQKAEARITTDSQPDLPELHKAAGHGDFGDVTRLLDAGADVNARDLDGWTPLHWAAYEGRTEVVRLLLARGASPAAEAESVAQTPGWGPPDVYPRAMPATWVRVHKRENKTPLRAALARGRKEAAEILLGLGVTAQQKNDLLLWCTEYDYAGGAEILLANGADARRVDDDGWTLVHWAARSGAGAVCEVFLAHGVDPNARARPKKLPGRPGRTTPADSTALHLGATYPEVIKALVAHGADATARDADGATPLHKVWDQGEAAELLLTHGANPNARDSKGETPLSVSMVFHNTSARDAILAHGGDVNARDAQGKSLLHKATTIELAAWLLDHGARLEAKDKEGRTPLHDIAAATWWGNGLENLKLLLSRGAEAEAKDAHGATPLAVAISSGNREVAVFLQQHTAAAHREPALQQAAYRGDSRAVRQLLRAGARVAQPDALGVTPLHAAVSSQNPVVVSLFLTRGAAVNVRDRFGWTPLHKAAYDGSTEIVKLLLQHKAKVKARAKDGDTPLHLAVQRGKLDTMRVLLDHGANPNAEGRDDTTPINRAWESDVEVGYVGEIGTDMTDLLEKYGGRW